MTHRTRLAFALPMACVALGLTSPALGGPEVLKVAGLTEPVEVLRDRWGISHIYAKNESDLFFAQGFNVARDRLFQLELWRRQATGTLAEIQGSRAFAHDLGSRLLRFRGDLKTEMASYHPRGGEIIGSFVRGINAYIDSTERDPGLLPVEFRALGIKPGRWTPEVVVSRHNGLFRNATLEIQAAKLVQALGEDRARELLNLHPGRPRLTPDPGRIGEEVLVNYKASRMPVRFRPEDLEPAYRGQSIAWNDPVESAGIEAQGSNNWVISGSKMASGAPIMANDPHRTIDLPSLRYWVHLVAPGWDVIGGGEPALPGVSIGHNTRGAWGFTIFPVDQEDLFVMETDPADPNKYRFQDGWESMRSERESITVKGRGPSEVDLKFTRHGPVIFEDRAAHRAYSLKAAWLEPGSAPYLASLRIDQAANWTEFREACGYFRTPSENMVWADVDGQIGWQAVGLAPIRKGWDGLLPVPGDGRFTWEGYVPPTELPSEFNPLRGWFASANQDNLPPGYTFQVGFQWSEAFRFQRISEVLERSQKIELAEMTRLQHDELSMPARALVPLLRNLQPTSDLAREAQKRLAGWDYILDRDSIPAAIYTYWERSLKAALYQRLVPPEVRDSFPIRYLSTQTVIRQLSGENPIAGRDPILLEALDRAVAELSKRLGSSMDRWRYGQPGFKHVWLPHPMIEAANPGLRNRLDLGPLPRGGAAHTINSTSDGDNQSTGASFRIIADAGDWDRSLGTNAPGQSGDPDSPHYRDLFVDWSQGRYFPVAYSRPKVESVTEAKTLLVPPSTP